MRVVLPFIVLVLMLGGCAHPMRTAMVIRAIGPTGGAFYMHPQPVWSFGITNTGNSEVRWEADINVRGGGDDDYRHAGGFVEWPQGVLLPGQGLITNMMVPALTGSVWRAEVDYWPTSTISLKTIKTIKTMKTYKDVWHRGAQSGITAK